MARLKKRQDGRYCKQVYIGTDASGKKLYKQIYGTTLKDVEREAAELKVKIGKGFDPTIVNTTFKAYADIFIAKKAFTVGKSWLGGIKNNVNHLRPLWSISIDKIKSIDIQNILNELAEWHDGKPPMARQSIRDIYITCASIFEEAIPDVTSYNPCNRYKVSLPTGAGTKVREPITQRQQELILKVPHRGKTAAMIMMFAGLRCGELCALTWADIDLAGGRILVNKSKDFKENSIKSPKTKAGDRTVYIPKQLNDYLKTVKNDSLYVVPTAKGLIMTNTAWRRMWDSYMLALEKANDESEIKEAFKPFTAHQLRHTYASLLYKAGVDVLTAKEQLGHADVKTTLEIYTHLDKKYKVNSMQKLNDFIDNTSQIQVKHKNIG
ncbi:MAG: site-specific integrase [Oscillospiraceae bacterium]